jgi:hypothetical protein
MTGLDSTSTNPLTIWETTVSVGETLMFGTDAAFTPAQTWDSLFGVFNRQAFLLVNPLNPADAGGMGLFTVAAGFGTVGAACGPNLKIQDPNFVSVSANQFGLGSNVLNIPTGTAPTVSAGNQELLHYNETGAAKVRSGNGVVTTIAPQGTSSAYVSDLKAGDAQTIGATTVTVCASDVIPDSSTVTLEVSLQGREATSGDIASTTFLMRARRVAGTLSLVGVETVLVSFALGSDAAINTATAVIDVSANTLRVRATGVAATVIDWAADMKVRINTP